MTAIALEDGVLYTAEEIAAHLRAEPGWVTRAAQRGVLPSRKVGRKRRFTKADVEEFLERSRQGTDTWARSPRSQSRRARAS